MAPAIGQWCLYFAMCLAVPQAFLGLKSSHQSPDLLVVVTNHIAMVGTVAVAGAYLCLSWAFFNNDFSLAFVADHSNLTLPLGYRIAAVWSGHEGALLLWLFVLQIWMLVWVRQNDAFPAAIARRATGLLALISLGSLLALLTSADPFRRLLWAPPDGANLSPLLQNPAMALHPPLLTIGYVGTCIPFAVAGAILIHGKFEYRWFGALRPWVIVAWLFLTLGISLGSWWSYYELGWGGWWSWDPINSVAFMPWLMLTALLHSLAVAKRHGFFTGWSVGLAICAFALSLIGSFASRSGALNSIHNFAEMPDQNIFVAVYFSSLIGVAAILALYRRSIFATTHMVKLKKSLRTRENFVLINNIMLSITATLIFIGTFAPTVLQTFGAGSVSVGRQYFDTVMIALMLPALVVAGLAMPVTVRYRSLSLVGSLRLPALLVLIIGLGWLGFYRGVGSILTVAGICTAIWLILLSILSTVTMTCQGNVKLAWRRSGMIIAHLGLALFVLGVTIAVSFSQQLTTRMVPGETLMFADFRIQLDGQENVTGVNYSALRASVSARDSNDRLEMLYPEKRVYGAMTSALSEVAISSNWHGDLFLALGDDLGGGAWIVTIQYKPLIRLIWVGVAIMFLGGLLAIFTGSRDALPVNRMPGNLRTPIIATLAIAGTAIIASGLFALTADQRLGFRSVNNVASSVTSAAISAAQLHLAEYRYDMARQAFADILAIHPNNNIAKLGLVQASLAIDHGALLGEAGNLIEEVLAEMPDDPDALWYGAKAAQSRGDPQLAYSRWSHLMNLGPPPSLQLAVAEQLTSIERRWHNKDGAAAADTSQTR